MADQKISQLSDGGASQATDEYVIARSGANYRIDGASIAAAATSVGTLTSLTVSGDVTVDTNTLKVDSANNRVGIGTTSPEQTVDIRTTAVATPALQLSSSENSASALGRIQWRNAFATAYPTVFAAVDAGIGAAGANPFIAFYTANTSLSGGTLTEKMRLDASGNLGLGTSSPSYILDVRGPSGSFTTLYGRNGATGASDGAQVLLGNSASFTNAFFRLNGGANSSQAGNGSLNIGVFANVPMAFYTNNIERVRIEANGNLGLGTSNGVAKLTIRQSSDATNGGIVIEATDGLGCAISRLTDGGMTFRNGGSERARITSGGSMVVGTAAIATTATDGFLYVPTCAGTPTGTPTTQTGTAPIVVDTTNNKLYFYSGGSWRDAGP